MTSATVNPTLLDEKSSPPTYLSQAAMKAARRWKDPEHQRKILGTQGSPGFKPTLQQAKQVELMAAMGLSPKEIGDILGIDKGLIAFYYAYEIKTTLNRVNVAVGKVALTAALSGNDTDMTKFWLQTRAGWSPKSQIDVTGVDKDADEARAAREKLLASDDVQEITAGGKD